MSVNVETDRALLRRYEPVICYTRGEQFFPMDVADYVQACSLWAQRPVDDHPVCLVPEGELSLNRLGEPRTDDFGTVYFLKFIEPLNLARMAAYRLQGLIQKDDRDVFYAGAGRLARVGYASRLVDAMFSLALLGRGRVPGDTAAAAALAYRQVLDQQEKYSYYGRVMRRNGWVVLQYWFFYSFNNWRSGFFGANDHEADWEMVCIYLYEAGPDKLRPEWVAYASHDYSGDDLRRRWDDPELEKIGEHPVLYAGAGSHASYFAPGEYLTEVELPFLSPLARFLEKQQKFWRRTLRYNGRRGERADQRNRREFNVFRVPFVDYARGDGLAIGPGQDKSWAEPNLLDPLPAWALNYRGLWGLYARDPLAGENAPAGPVYNRDGTMRRSWYDPLGWAGLDKLPPPDKALKRVLERREAIQLRLTALNQAINKKHTELTGLGVEAAAMQGQPHLKKLYEEHQEKIAELSAKLKDMRARSASDEALLEALELYEDQLRRGEQGPARAHLRRAYLPASEVELRLNRFAEFWAAVSIGVMMIGFVGVIIFARQYAILGLSMLLSLLIFIEANFRKQLQHLITSITIGLAVVSTLIIFYEFFWDIIVLAVLISGGYIMWENLRELWG